MLLGWAFMTLTALFLTEVNLWMKKDAHIITMASTLLGPIGKAVAWIFYLFICYASLTAYTAGCADLVQSAVANSLGFVLPQWVAAGIFVLLFGFVIYLGNVMTGRINTMLMCALVISYVALVGGGLGGIEWKNLMRGAWGDSLIAAPLLLTIFSFQTIVPSLTIYLERDAKRLRLACILGTTLALIVYLFWQLLVLGSVLSRGSMAWARRLFWVNLQLNF